MYNQVPAASVAVDSAIALNKCRWHQSGHSIAVGDDLGKIHVYDVGEVSTVLEEKHLHVVTCNHTH